MRSPAATVRVFVPPGSGLELLDLRREVLHAAEAAGHRLAGGASTGPGSPAACCEEPVGGLELAVEVVDAPAAAGRHRRRPGGSAVGAALAGGSAGDQRRGERGDAEAGGERPAGRAERSCRKGSSSGGSDCALDPISAVLPGHDSCNN